MSYQRFYKLKADASLLNGQHIRIVLASLPFQTTLNTMRWTPSGMSGQEWIIKVRITSFAIHLEKICLKWTYNTIISQSYFLCVIPPWKDMYKMNIYHNDQSVIFRVCDCCRILQPGTYCATKVSCARWPISGCLEKWTSTQQMGPTQLRYLTQAVFTCSLVFQNENSYIQAGFCEKRLFDMK